MHFIQAEIDDYQQLGALLRSNHLPVDDIDNDAICFLVKKDNESIVACGALEQLDGYCLLRSVAVDESHRNKGLAKTLCYALLARADANRFGDVYLLTIDAADYFARLGFESVEREHAPEPIRLSNQFSELCPGSAVVMRYVGG